MLRIVPFRKPIGARSERNADCCTTGELAVTGILKPSASLVQKRNTGKGQRCMELCQYQRPVYRQRSVWGIQVTVLQTAGMGRTYGVSYGKHTEIPGIGGCCRWAQTERKVGKGI